MTMKSLMPPGSIIRTFPWCRRRAVLPAHWLTNG